MYVFYIYSLLILFKMGHPGLFFIYFWSFQTYINTILQLINVKKCPSSIQRWDSNPRPYKHESSPITTRPGLPPMMLLVFIANHLLRYIMFHFGSFFKLANPRADVIHKFKSSTAEIKCSDW